MGFIAPILVATFASEVAQASLVSLALLARPSWPRERTHESSA